MCCFGLWCVCDAALLHARVPGVFSAALGAGRVCTLMECTQGRTRAKREVRRHKKRVLVGGIEPTTLGLLDPRSDQLSYTSTLREEVVEGAYATPDNFRTDDPKRSVAGHQARDVDYRVIECAHDPGSRVRIFFVPPKKEKRKHKNESPMVLVDQSRSRLRLLHEACPKKSV